MSGRGAGSTVAIVNSAAGTTAAGDGGALPACGVSVPAGGPLPIHGKY
ncbi:hypothetical protein GR927_23125 [Mycolicibacterium sp. 3033]|nr:hypothetical protein [Mycolicibacterium aurantiacum]